MNKLQERRRVRMCEINPTALLRFAKEYTIVFDPTTAMERAQLWKYTSLQEEYIHPQDLLTCKTVIDEVWRIVDTFEPSPHIKRH